MPHNEGNDVDSSWEYGWLDRQFRDTPLVVLLLFGLCCGEIALIFSILGVALCRERTARTNATLVFIVSAIRACVSVTAVAIQVYWRYLR